MRKAIRLDFEKSRQFEYDFSWKSLNIIVHILDHIAWVSKRF